MSDAAFREALKLVVECAVADNSDLREYEWNLATAKAHLIALYAEASRGMTPEESAQYKAFLRSRFTPAERQGKEFTVQVAYAKGGLAKVDVSGSFLVGDRVRVTKVEEGQ